MKNYTISQKRFDEIVGLTEHFERLEEHIEIAMTQADESKEMMEFAYALVSKVKGVLYDKPLADTNETALQKLVRTSGLSAEELNRIVGGE